MKATMETRRELSTGKLILSAGWLVVLVLGLVAALDWLARESMRSAWLMAVCLLLNTAVVGYAMVRAFRHPRGGSR